MYYPNRTNSEPTFSPQSRRQSLAARLAGPYEHIPGEVALRSLYRGEVTGDWSRLDQLADDDLIMWSGEIVGALGLFLQANPHRVGAIRTAIEKAGDGTRRYGTGLGDHSIGALVTVWAEIDHLPRDVQARMWDELVERTGLDVALVDLTGDDRPSACAHFGIDPAVVKKGKSLHGFLAIEPLEATEQNKARWHRTMSLLCVALGSDTAVRDPSHKMRCPDRVMHVVGVEARIQTALFANPDARRYTLDELDEILRADIASRFGVTVEEGIEALQLAEALRKFAKKAPGLEPDDVAEIATLAEAIWVKRRGTIEEVEYANLILGRDLTVPGASPRAAGGSGPTKRRSGAVAGGIDGNTLVTLRKGGAATLDAIAAGLKPGGKTIQVFCPNHSNTTTPSGTVGITKGGTPFLRCFGSCGRPWYVGDWGTDAGELDVGELGAAKSPAQVEVPGELPPVVPPAPSGAGTVRVRKVTRYTTAELVQGRYLPNEPLRHRVTYLPVLWGAGKTTLAAWVMDQQPADARKGATAPRRSLVTSLSAALNLPDYRDIKGAIRGSAAWCLDSSHRIDTVTTQDGEVVDDVIDVLLLDEVRQLRHALYGGTMDGYESMRALDAITRIVRASRQVVVADADLDATDIRFVRHLLGWKSEDETDEEIRLAEVPSRYEYEVTTGSDVPWRHRLFRDWESGKKLAIPMMADSACHVLAQELEARRPGARVVVLTAEVLLDAHKLGLDLDQINEWVRDVDALVYSPSMGTGVSITVTDHFDAIYGCMFQHVGTAGDILQMLHRVRSPRENVIRVWVQPGGRPRSKSADPEKIRATLLSIAQQSAKKVEEADLLRATVFDPDTGLPVRANHFTWYVETLAERRRWGADGGLYDALTRLLDRKGLTWREMASAVTKDERREILDQKAAARESTKEAAYARLHAAQNVSIEEARACREPSSSAEFLANEKAELAHFYGVRSEDVTIELVRKDEGGKRRDRLRKLAALLAVVDGHEQALLRRDAAGLNAGTIVPLVQRGRTSPAKALRTILGWYSVDFGSGVSLYYRDKSRPLIQDVIVDPSKFDARLARRADRVLAELGFTVPKTLEEQPMQWLHYILRSIGLDLKSERKTAGYQLDGGAVSMKRPKVRKAEGGWELPDGRVVTVEPKIKRVMTTSHYIPGAVAIRGAPA